MLDSFLSGEGAGACEVFESDLCICLEDFVMLGVQGRAQPVIIHSNTVAEKMINTPIT